VSAKIWKCVLFGWGDRIPWFPSIAHHALCDFQVSSYDQRQRLLQQTERLQGVSGRVQDTHRVALETEDVREPFVFFGGASSGMTDCGAASWDERS
jgi:hypothetical protein